MSLRETVNAFGRDVSAHFKRDSYCAFAAPEETEGFLDTSAELDGSRGIAFLCDSICVDFDGIIRRVNYEDIKETELIESFESDYADELLIKGKTAVRVSDFSINKRFLKLLVDTLCLRYGHSTPEERERCRRECRARSSARYTEIDEAAAVVAKQVAERTAKKSRPRPSEGQPARQERSAKPVRSAPQARREQTAQPARPAQPVKSAASVKPDKPAEKTAAAVQPAKAPTAPPAPPLPELDIEEPRFSVPEDHVPLEITEEKIEWLSGPHDLDDPDEVSERDLEDMNREETMSYLLSSINEINAPAEPRKVSEKTESAAAAAEAPSAPATSVAPTTPTVPTAAPEAEKAAPEEEKAAAPEEETPDEPPSAEEYIPPVIEEIAVEAPESSDTSENDPEPAAEPSPFTVEPPSDDIYIKASRKIREICESGRLTREEIQNALKDNLVSAAARFAEVTGEGVEIPRLLAPKIEELRTASESLERYFALGEDIAERVMFFMMYQMLSYSDRIVEAPETKERLNDFFKRYGPSGIMLSMLDMRVQ